MFCTLVCHFVGCRECVLYTGVSFCRMQGVWSVHWCVMLYDAGSVVCTLVCHFVGCRECGL